MCVRTHCKYQNKPLGSVFFVRPGPDGMEGEVSIDGGTVCKDQFNF